MYVPHHLKSPKDQQQACLYIRLYMSIRIHQTGQSQDLGLESIDTLVKSKNINFIFLNEKKVYMPLLTSIWTRHLVPVTIY